MADGEQDQQNIQADHDSVAVGSVSVGGSVDGSLVIGSHNVVGYTSDQVSTLIAQISTTFQPKPFDGRSPYKGLDVFEEEDAELFFGREKLVDDLVVRVRESRTLFVTGPSGSGKSSLARAGLIHALRQGSKEFTSDRWLYATMKPGRDPIEALASAFSRLKDPGLGKYLRENAGQASALHECAESVLTERKDQRLVVFIDQFEEVFTQLSKDKAETFIQLLDCAANIEDGRTILLFAMRSDFITNCVVYPKLNALLNRQFVQIGAMQGDELVSAIAQPALRVGLRIDPDLIAQIINDMQGEPGALPLMQFALKDLFDAQQAKGGLIALMLKDYLERGGIRKALERHADNSFNRLNGHERKLTRAIFSSLIEIGRGTVDTRRTAVFDELVPASARSAEVEAIVRKLADARLLTTDEIGGKDTVTISHEKLIDAWPWLKRLVDENRDVIAAQNEIAKDAKEWDDHGRDPSYLYSGARLGVVEEQLSANKMVLSGLAKDFIDEGIALREAERKAKESLRRRIVGGLIAGIAIALVLAGFAVYQMFQAQRQAAIARVGELAAQSVAARTKNFSVSLLLGIEAFKLDRFDSVQARSNLLDNIQTNPQLEGILSGRSGNVFSVAFSRDGKTLASSSDRTIILWDVEKRQAIGQPLSGHSDTVTSVAFSPDGKTLASGSDDGTIILWDVATHQPIGQPLQGHRGNAMSVPFFHVLSVAFSPDGKTLASGSNDNTIVLWDVEKRQAIGQLFSEHSHIVTSVAFSPDGKMLASGSLDDTIILWDVEKRQAIDQPLSGHSGFVESVAFSPDGKMLASGSDDKTIILWDVEKRQAIDQPLRGHSNWIWSVAFSPDGKTLASGSLDKTIMLWDVEKRQAIDQPLSGHSDSVTSVAFSPDGKTLASGSNDNTSILWDVEKRQAIGQPLSGHSQAVQSVTFSPDGKTLASASCVIGDGLLCSQGEIILWDVEKHQAIGQPLQGHRANVFSVAFSPDGKTLASASCAIGDGLLCSQGEIILWDVEKRQAIGQPLHGHSNWITSVAFSPDGKTLASGSMDGTIILWDVEKRQAIGQPLRGNLWRMAFSPDGKTLASGSVDGTIILWDVEKRQAIGQPLRGHLQDVESVAFSPDGKMLASGSDDKTIILWDVQKRQAIGQLLSGYSDTVTSVAFSPDGKMLASGSKDSTIILWDVEKGQAIGQPLSGHSQTVESVAFSPDGKMLASGSDDSTIILWDLDPHSWVEKSCQRVNRNFTRAEWAQYIPYKRYPSKQEDATCPQWPLELEPVTTPTATP